MLQSKACIKNSCVVVSSVVKTGSVLLASLTADEYKVAGRNERQTSLWHLVSVASLSAQKKRIKFSSRMHNVRSINIKPTQKKCNDRLTHGGMNSGINFVYMCHTFRRDETAQRSFYSSLESRILYWNKFSDATSLDTLLL